jgi:arylamine N-acetyltransferase
MVNIVTLEGRRCLVDVGFGSNGPHQPIPLVATPTLHNVGDQSLRLRPGPIDQHAGRHGQRLWLYEHRNGDGPWIPTYCFTDIEFLPEDFTMINYYMSTSWDSWFTFHVVCVRMILDEQEQLVGDLTLFNNQLKRRIGATSEVLATFTSEDERVAALEKYFGIALGESERAAIHRTISEVL